MKLIIKPYISKGPDGFHVILMDGETEVSKTDYKFGYTVSYTIKQADFSEKLRNQAIESGNTSFLDTYYPERPYVPVLIGKLCREHGLTINDVEVIPGQDEWTGQPMSDELIISFKHYLKEVVI